MKRHLFLSFLVLLIVAACSVDPKPELGENDEKYLSFYEGLIIDGSIKIHFAGDTREAPEVLILEIGTVAPTHDLHGDEVLAGLHKEKRTI